MEKNIHVRPLRRRQHPVVLIPLSYQVGEPDKSKEATTPGWRAMRVVVANQPRILRESIAMAIATLDEVEVVIGAAHDAAAILRSVRQHKPDCLILSLEVRDANPRLCRAVLSRFPQTLILAIGPKTLTVYWFEGVVRSERRECSLSTILGLLRTTLTERRTDATPAMRFTEREQLCT